MMDNNCKSCLGKMCFKLACILGFLKPIANLCVRIYIAKIFFMSGLTKIDNWNSTLFLFEHEYMIPLLPFKAAAVMAVVMELIIAPMFAFGFMSRISGLLLFIMTLVMNYGYQPATENYYWMMLIGMIMTYGGSKLSLDYILIRKFCNKSTKTCPCCGCAVCNYSCNMKEHSKNSMPQTETTHNSMASSANHKKVEKKLVAIAKTAKTPSVKKTATKKITPKKNAIKKVPTKKSITKKAITKKAIAKKK